MGTAHYPRLERKTRVRHQAENPSNKKIQKHRKKDYNVTYKLVLYDIKSVVRSPIQTDRSITLLILIRPVVVFLSEVSTLYHS